MGGAPGARSGLGKPGGRARARRARGAQRALVESPGGAGLGPPRTGGTRAGGRGGVGEPGMGASSGGRACSRLTADGGPIVGAARGRADVDSARVPVGRSLGGSGRGRLGHPQDRGARGSAGSFVGCAGCAPARA